MNISKLILASLLISTVGCLRTRNDMQENDNKRQMQEQVTTLQKSTADQNARFQEIDEDLRKLNGRIEVMENRESQGSVREKSTQTQIDEINRKLSLLQDSLLKMESDINTLAQNQNRMSSDARNSAGKEKDAAPSKGRTFDKAEDFFKEKKWKEAIVAYQNYRDKNPSGKNFSESTYKIGVCFQELGMKDEAKVFYEEAIAKYPKSDAAKRSRIRLKQVQ
ncbi:MAG: tetratricopeptide repeat protein [Pseudobdellovibrionaceae bacterium]